MAKVAKTKKGVIAQAHRLSVRTTTGKKTRKPKALSLLRHQVAVKLKRKRKSRK
jgi:hypothetical protein